jgi:hypothetical protein
VDLDDGWGDEDEEVQENIKRKKIEKEAQVATQSQSQSLSTSDSSLTLPVRKRIHDSVADLIRLLFDKEMMKKQLVSLDIDIRKMPLGKISKKQIMQVYILSSSHLPLFTIIFLYLYIYRDIVC